MPTSLQSLLLPELILITVACVLFLVGLSQKASSRRLAAMLAMAALVVVFAIQIARVWGGETQTQFDGFGGTTADGAHYGTVRIAAFAQYIKLITAGMGIILMLLAWPTNAESTGNTALSFGQDAGEFY